ncbi:MAG TPA: heavy metal-associated domain-containing protein [Acidobacteriaceae bacterium]|nr:heavy metal-associated domain-containing protein [Acidobacteriaceae bacterium]
MREVTLRIGNMHCDGCVRRVSQTLGNVKGVKVGEVRVGVARVQAPEEMPDETLVGALEKAGYPVTAVEQ